MRLTERHREILAALRSYGPFDVGTQIHPKTAAMFVRLGLAEYDRVSPHADAGETYKVVRATE